MPAERTLSPRDGGEGDHGRTPRRRPPSPAQQRARAALSKLGLDAIRCPTLKSVYRKRGCNMWSDLDGLLLAALAVASSMSLVELAKAEQEVIGDLTTVVKDFWQV